ncbi:LPD16 domain-containing protein, partial [Faecalibacterium prausnitzii]
NWYLFELSDDDRKAIQQESVKILENIPQVGIGRRRIWEPETLPKDIRLINSHYDDLYRIPDGGVIQVDYPNGHSFTARVEHLDDYHFDMGGLDMGGLGNVFHICQFAEVMERNHADFYPEIQTQDEQAAWELGGKGYLAIQSCEDGWDYTLYHSDYSVMDGGQLDAPELTIQEAREQILEAHHMEKGRRLLQDYDAVMDKVTEAEELSADHRPSTLEKLAELASDTSAPKSSARSAPEL